MCLDTLGYAAPTVIGLGLCHGHGNNQVNTKIYQFKVFQNNQLSNSLFLQLFRLNAKGQLGNGERCVDADKQGIKLVFCRLGTVDGPWEYDKVVIKCYSKSFFMKFLD